MNRKHLSKSPLVRILQSFSLIFSGILIGLISVVDARPIAPDDSGYSGNVPYYCCGTVILADKAISRKDGYVLTVHGVLLGIFLIATGLVLLSRVYHDGELGINARFVAGFIAMALVTWVLLTNFEPAGTYGTYRWTIYLVVCFVVGALGGLIIGCAFHLFLMVLSGLGALAFGLWLLGWREDLVIVSSWGRALFLSLLVLAGLIIAPLVWFAPIVGAAFAGAYIFILGLDIFFHTGFTYGPLCTLDDNPHHRCEYSMSWQVYVMLASVLVLALIGIVDQTRHQRLRMQHAHYYSYNKGFLPFLRG